MDKLTETIVLQQKAIEALAGSVKELREMVSLQQSQISLLADAIIKKGGVSTYEKKQN